MKYMNILAGAIGLMALAACNDNNEVAVEQPNGVRTITVAYNQGANTRYDITVNTELEPPYHAYQYAQGFKVEWTVGDQIDLIKDGVTYTYEAQESGDVATFTLVSDTAPTAEGDYKVAFPAGWGGNLGGSLSFAIQDLEDFDVTKYLHATGTATLSGGSFGETVNLTPLFSFLYIPESTRFIDMGYYVDTDTADEYDEESSLWKGDVYLLGDNLYNKIDNFEGDTGDVEGIRLENFGVYNDWIDDVWKASVDYIIAVPVLDQPVQYMYLQFTGIETSCIIRHSDPWTDEYYLTIDKGGLIYNLAEDGESFLFD